MFLNSFLKLDKQLNELASLWSMGGNWGTWRKPTQSQGDHAAGNRANHCTTVPPT